MTPEIYERRKAELIEEITAAFNGVKRGLGVTLHEAEVMNDYHILKERELARLKDYEARWQDIREKHILNMSDVLNYLDDRGFHYYLPAYLVCYLRHMDDTNALDLEAPTGYKHIERQLYNRAFSPKALRILTAEQKRAVAHFLVFLEQKEQAWKAQEFEELRAKALTWSNSVEEAEAYVQKMKEDLPELQSLSEYKLALDEYWGQFL